MNKVIITLISILVIIGAIIFGVALYTPKKEEAPTTVERIAEENIVDDCTDEYDEIQNQMIETNAQEEKISPNASMTLNRYYTKCGHTASEYLEVPEELVNKTKNELQEKYAGWKVSKFTDSEIVLEKEENGECGEHYIVREDEGKVTIYEVLSDGTEKEYERTEIATEYLTETDKSNMEKGIIVNGKQNLNQLIEDFE